MTTLQQAIAKIIQDGTQAPSGENCQPWRFKVEGNKISVFNIPEADRSLYNSHQKGSYIAHGALLENMLISGEQYGYTLDVTLFPHKEDETHVSDIVVTKSAHQVDVPLYDTIYRRCTNRKDFTGETLTEIEKKELTDSVAGLGFNMLTIVDDEKHVKTLGVALAAHEKVLFENKKLHDFFYDHIFWNKKDEEKAGGFYIDTLEFLPHQLKGVKLFKNWFVLTILNRVLKVSTMISKENGEKYAASGTFVALTMRGTTHKDYVNLGRSLERFWLTATLHNIAVHPCNGTLYLMGHSKDNGTGDFIGEHISLIEKSYKDIVTAFHQTEAPIGFICRVGKADSPTAVAKRIMPSVDYL